jgi:hypothetical protein
MPKMEGVYSSETLIPNYQTYGTIIQINANSKNVL